MGMHEPETPPLIPENLQGVHCLVMPTYRSLLSSSILAFVVEILA